MKKLLLIAIVVTTQFFAWAGPEDFEGNITFGIDLEGTGTDILKAMLPNSYVYVLKEDQMIFRMEGGMAGGMLGEVMINANDGHHYVVKHKEQTAYKIDPESMKEGKSTPTDAEITALDEYQDIVGYKCRKYKVTVTQDGKKMDQFLWATTDIKIKGQDDINPELSGNIFYEGVKGFPLKMETTIDKMGMSFKMIMTANSVQKQQIESGIFTLPASYKIEPFDASKMMGF
ncbi:MAG: DUF4412 domain-containing protein [Chitinophagales bacterium]